MYCLRRPHRDLVLSETKPMTGSVIASTTLGKKKIKPHIKGSNPKSCTNTTIKTPRAAGNICIASIPSPKKIFLLVGICVVGVFKIVLFMLVLVFNIHFHRTIRVNSRKQSKSTGFHHPFVFSIYKFEILCIQREADCLFFVW